MQWVLPRASRAFREAGFGDVSKLRGSMEGLLAYLGGGLVRGVMVEDV